jgi:hypothetical protein
MCNTSSVIDQVSQERLRMYKGEYCCCDANKGTNTHLTRSRAERTNTPFACSNDEMNVFANYIRNYI